MKKTKLKRYLTSIFLLVIYASLGAEAKEQDLCPRIVLKDGKFKLNKNEKILVCGDDGASAWKEVPFEQAQIELKALFQKEGYFSPRFEEKDNRLWVELGPRTTVQHWKLSGEPAVVEQRKKRKVIDEPMTPAKLDEIEKWVDGELKARGYACPQIQNKALVWSESVESSYQPGARLAISSLQRQGMDNLDAEAFKRFEAFEVGEIYDNRKLQITSNRLLADGLAQSSYYTQACNAEGVELIHHLELGEPRLLRFGFGASSEEFPFLDAWFKNTRIDNRASSYWLLLHASPRVQSLEGSSELYILPFSKRTFVGPRFRVARSVETAYETLSGKTGVDIGRLWDAANNRFEFRFGPTVNYLNTIEGFGPDDVSYLTLEGSLAVQNNDHELTGVQQYTGTKGSLQYQGQREGLGSPLNADRWTLKLKNLWDLRDLSPPFLVLGSRFESSVTTSDSIDQSTSRETLPTEYRIFLGGEENLRGFNRQSLNNNGLGYLTSAYLGLELRLIEELPWNLEPLILWDGAMVGLAPWHWDGPWFESYGVGMRWRSPIGPIRVTAARGVVHRGDEGTEPIPEKWAFQFSFGKEF